MTKDSETRNDILTAISGFFGLSLPLQHHYHHRIISLTTLLFFLLSSCLCCVRLLSFCFDRGLCRVCTGRSAVYP